MIEVWKLTWICNVAGIMTFIAPILSWEFFRVETLMDNIMYFYGISIMITSIGLGLSIGKYILNWNEQQINQKVKQNE